MVEENREKIVGILGGMGPLATVDFMQRIIDLTPARDDIDHIRCIVDNNPKIPSRIKAIIEGTGENPGPVMGEMARGLESWGADFLVIPCNTAHNYIDYVKKAVKIPVIDVIDLVVREHGKRWPDSGKVGVLASTAVIMTELYEKRFREKGIEVVYPDEVHQERLFELIKDIKAGENREDARRRFVSICENLAERGATAAVVACTELSVIGEGLPVETIDASDVLAREVVAVAGVELVS